MAENNAYALLSCMEEGRKVMKRTTRGDGKVTMKRM